MSDKRKKRKFTAKRQQRRRKELDETRHFVNGVELPASAVAADQAQQGPNNSYSPPDYYVDIAFTCRDCGRNEVWSAQQQKWYYEVAKGPIYGAAVRCTECRRRRREEGGQVGDPHPIKHQGGLLKRARLAIEPALAAAGFAFDARNRPQGDESMWIDFQRPGIVLRVLIDRQRASLVAECIDQNAEHQEIASTALTGLRSSAELRERIEAFRSAVVEFLDGLPPANDSVNASENGPLKVEPKDWYV